MFNLSLSLPGYSSLIPFFQYYSNHKLKIFLKIRGGITQPANYSNKSTIKITEGALQKGYSKKFLNIHKKHLCKSILLMKLPAYRLHLCQKGKTQVFSLKILQNFLKKLFLHNASKRLLLQVFITDFEQTLGGHLFSDTQIFRKRTFLTISY